MNDKARKRSLQISIFARCVVMTGIISSVVGLWTGYLPSRWVLTTFLVLLAYYILDETGKKIDEYKFWNRALKTRESDEKEDLQDRE